MHPRLIDLSTPEWLQGILPPHIIVYAYGFMIALGILVAFIITLKKSRKFGLKSEDLSTLFMWIFLAAFIGGKLFFYLEDFGHYLENPSEMLRITGGGFVFYGSLIFAIPVIVWWLKKQKIPVRPFLDVLAFAGPVVHSFGRVGCFLAGCCHGKECHNFLGVVFSDPHSMARPLNTPLYPTQLFDIALNMIILMVVLSLNKRKQFEGQLFLLYILMYALGRSVVEEFRGDEARGFVFGGLLSHSQLIAIVMTAAVVLVWRRWKKNNALW